MNFFTDLAKRVLQEVLVSKIKSLFYMLTPSVKIISKEKLNKTLLALAEEHKNCHLRALLYSGESFIFKNTYSKEQSSEFKQITLLLRNYVIEKKEEAEWNKEKYLQGHRPWKKFTSIKSMSENLEVLNEQGGNILEKKFYCEQPVFFIYIFGKKAAIYSTFVTFPYGDIPEDVNGKRGGSRYKAWFYPIILVKNSDDVGRRVIEALLADFRNHEKAAISDKKMKAEYEQATRKNLS